jgi:hypothetical protein
MEVTFNKTDQVNNKHARDKRTKKTCPSSAQSHPPPIKRASSQSVSQSVAAAVVRPRFPYYTYILTTVSRMYLAHVMCNIQQVQRYVPEYQTARSSRTTLSDHEVWIRSSLICPPLGTPSHLHIYIITFSTAYMHILQRVKVK